MQKRQENVEVLRQDYLNQEELFLIEYMEGFDREKEKKWQLENLAIFSAA